MSDRVEVTKLGDVAVITINNPPVNALSPGVPEGIETAIEQVNQDNEVSAAVLIGAGNTFVAGADINEFVKMTSGLREPGNLQTFLRKVEDSRKPIVVAIHGNALGGGLELAMACHYRLVSPTARVGQPEVRLGIIPGAAGTQRLPRLAGVAKAVAMCSNGKPITAAEAVEAGILDQLIDGDLLEGAAAFARKIAKQPAPKTRERNDRLGTAQDNAAIIAAARETIKKKYPSLQAPLVAVDSIETGVMVGFDEGCKREREYFKQCLFSDQSKALVHVFLAEREASKIPDVPKDTAIIPVKRVGVIGAGTMGAGIAVAFADAGFEVRIKEADQSALDRGMANIERSYQRSVKRGRLVPKDAQERLDRIEPILDYASLAESDLVIEAVFENMALKKEVFSELDRVCKPGVILATNSSTLNIDEIAASTSRPSGVIGLHFFTPANVTRSLEVVRGAKTAKEVIATCMRLGKKIGKVAVLAGNCWGFVGNRMFIPYIEEAEFMVEEGASPETVDQVLRDFGMVLGPLATCDLAGLDVAWRIRQERKEQKPAGRRPHIEGRLFGMGRYGRKTGAGWFQYDANGRASSDGQIAERLPKWRADSEIPQRDLSAGEITERCIYVLANEGAKILEEGYALRSGDIDTIYVNGYGFPAFRGGPMWYADTVGLKKVYERMCEFQKEHGHRFEPARLFKRLAESNGKLSDYRRDATQK
jgi:3-hydroxyacyl-CoA dehydrogenase